VAGALTIIFLSNQSIERRVPTAPAVASSGADQTQPTQVADSQDPLLLDEEYVDTSPDPVPAARPTARSRVHRGTVAVSAGMRSQRGIRRSIQIAEGGPSPRHALNEGARSTHRSLARLDTRHLDGAGTSGNTDARDYVLAPVSASSDSDSGADYVMGSVMMNARTAEIEEARGL
jgi:hypothetical protein